MKSALANLSFALRTIRRHPLTRDRLGAALWRYCKWQVGCRLVPGPVLVPWVNGCRLTIARGMWGATLNLYCGLQDFESMAFVAHLLRKDEVFFDVGANVGVYSVLAAGVAHARTVAVEPGNEAAAALALNLRVNNLVERVEARAEVIGATMGAARFTCGLDTLNHVAATEAEGGLAREVAMTTLDHLAAGRCPRLIKLDTEGYETAAIEGAQQTLADAGLWGLIVELDGHGQRYGYDEAALHGRLIELGFAAHAYDPLARSITPRPAAPPPTGNVLYLRVAAVEQISKRVAGAPPFEVLGRRI
jgi:FkbM family methyltransferase